MLGLLVFLGSTLGERAPLQRITDNDNRTPAGTLHDGVLTLHLQVTHGMWYPDADTDPGTDAIAFAEEGHAPSIPGPLIRVPVGTEVRTTVHNALADSDIVVIGLTGKRGMADTGRLRPGETRELITHATAAGTFLYRAVTSIRPRGVDPRVGDDGMLGGAFLVDPPGRVVPDRIFVLMQWIDTLRLKPRGAEGDELLTINGRSWPNTERLQYSLGDTIRWRIVNVSFDTHPMHLHGAFFTVLSHGGVNADTIYSVADRHEGVTERMAPLTTMTMQWVPPHAGNWLFHCHLNFHIMGHPSLGPDTAYAGMSSSMPEHRMGGLVLGVIVHGPVAADPRPHRHLRLVVEQYDSVPGELTPPFSFERDNARRMTIPGAPIIVTQNEPIAITIVNHTPDGTSVHWHGLEIESYDDGVAGFDGDAHRTAPLIQPHDSFTVQLTPPRAGTFIYHSHYDDIRQQGGGLYGAFIVLPPGTRWDAQHERVIIFGEARDTSAIKINGVDHPTIAMQRGATYRLRLINITLDRANLHVSLTRNDTLMRWHLVAHDGADLPARQARQMPATLLVTIGQTDDAMFTPDRAGTYALEARDGKGDLLRSATIVVTERARAGAGARRLHGSRRRSRA
jgi:FtsP/CotA-like multicopper oxidase with cupredoxin domain